MLQPLSSTELEFSAVAGPAVLSGPPATNDKFWAKRLDGSRTFRFKDWPKRDYPSCRRHGFRPPVSTTTKTIGMWNLHV